MVFICAGLSSFIARTSVSSAATGHRTCCENATQLSGQETPGWLRRREGAHATRQAASGHARAGAT